MGGPKNKPSPPPETFFCGMCEGKFSSKKAYTEHIANHPEPDNKAVCSTCKWDFNDTHMLEQHRILTGHGVKHDCRCGAEFAKISDLHKHRTFPSPCSDAFRNSPLTTNKLMLSVESPSTPLTAYGGLNAPVPGHYTASPVSTSGVYCHTCRQIFSSQARCMHHVLGCAAKAGEIGSVHGDSVQDDVVDVSLSGDNPPLRLQSRTEAAEPLQSSSRPENSPAVSVPSPAAPSIPTPAPTPTPAKSIPTVAVTPATAEFACNIKGCQKSFRSEQGLNAHKTDIHQIGGRGLDMRGKDSWMLSQSARQRLKDEGLLTVPHPNQKRRAVGQTARQAFMGRAPAASHAPVPSRMSAPLYTPAPRAASQPLAVPSSTSTNRAIPQQIAPPLPPLGQSPSGVYELQQGDEVCKQIQHLRIAANIVVQNDGKFVVDELAWTRIGIARQLDLASMLEKFAAISAKAQRAAYLPSPNAFSEENSINYPTEEFEDSPARIPEHPALGVVAIVCSKILLADGCQEVVKIAAVDMLSCRVLLNHLVCTDPSARVKDWKTQSTGLAAFYDIEAARQDGYKVMMGWKAVRTALFKYIDKETMLVGQNLRADLDALRIIHGRAVDIAKSVEKAAKGALSKQQLSLESLCRDFAGARLVHHPVYGQNVLQAAFGAREMVLWMLKNEDQFVSKAKTKSLDYQRLG